MKNFIKTVAVILIMALVCNTETKAQTKQELKEQVRILKQQQKLQDLQQKLQKKACKDAEKEAKKLIKALWQTLGLPIANQLCELFTKMIERNPDGSKRYIVNNNLVTANTITAGQMMLESVAATRIASALGAFVISNVKLDLKNDEGSRNAVVSITKAAEDAQIKVTQQLSVREKVLEIYREPYNTDGYQIRMSVIYDKKYISEIQREALIAELEKMGMDNDQLETCKTLVNNVCVPSRIPDEVPAADQILD
jgi:hypothetical protein